MPNDATPPVNTSTNVTPPAPQDNTPASGGSNTPGTETPPQDGGGNTPPAPPAFADSLPEEYRERFKEAGGMEDVLAELKKAEEGRMVPPETADGYDLQVPEGLTPDDDLLTGFKAAAHEMGLSQGVAQRITDIHNQWLLNLTKQQHEIVEQANAALDKDWGDKKEERLGKAQLVVERFGGEELAQELLLSEGSNPQLVKAFYAIYEAMGESALVDGGPASKEETIEPEDAYKSAGFK